MTEREKLLGRVRMYDFALVDVIPVSYTHLDVYKRQLTDIVDTSTKINFECIELRNKISDR